MTTPTPHHEAKYVIKPLIRMVIITVFRWHEERNLLLHFILSEHGEGNCVFPRGKNLTTLNLDLVDVKEVIRAVTDGMHF